MPEIYTHIPQDIYPQYVIPAEELTNEQLRIMERMAMPDAAGDLIDFFFTAEDQNLILSHEAGEPIEAAQLDQTYVRDAFRRGIISRCDESGKLYRLNTFYSLLDVFCVGQTEKYRSLPKKKRKELDAWYFRAYMDSLDPNLTHRPTADKVVTYQEMLTFLEHLVETGHDLHLCSCDCKSLNGGCGAPDRTCISFAPGINSYVDRGLSQQITLDEAKDVIRQAEAAGVMHTVSDHGICNCCDDCCYLFRGQRERQSVGFWPESPYVVSMDSALCISCGRCTKRCRMQVFTKQGSGRDAQISMDAKSCVGCELCVNTCPTGALRLVNRPAELVQINGVRGGAEHI